MDQRWQSSCLVVGGEVRARGLAPWAEEGPGWRGSGGGLGSLCVLEMAAGRIFWNWQTKCLSGKWWVFFFISTLVLVLLLRFACSPCCPPFAADLDQGLFVCSLVTLPYNSAVPPSRDPIKAILCYQTKVTVDLRSQIVHPSCESSADGREGSPRVFSCALGCRALFPLPDLNSTCDVPVSPVNDCTEPALPCSLGVRPGWQVQGQAQPFVGSFWVNVNSTPYTGAFKCVFQDWKKGHEHMLLLISPSSKYLCKFTVFWTDCFSSHDLLILCELLDIIRRLIKSDLFGNHLTVLPRYFYAMVLSCVGYRVNYLLYFISDRYIPFQVWLPLWVK